MEWFAIVQTSIDYIENHILEDIDYNDLANSVYVSSFHFHSAFSLIVGMTANEYIRKRRFSMAGQELILSDVKVIDIALKYGYESPESFSKAFTRFHGITPNQARQSGAKLTLFNPLRIKVIVDGGNVMDYKIVERKEFTLLTKVKAFENEKINEKGNHDIPDFWDECGKTGVFEILNQYRSEESYYGICSPVSAQKSCFDYGIGVICGDDAIPPEGYRKWNITSGLWAVFGCFGSDGTCLEGKWEQIYKEFFPQTGYQMRNYPDFEYYPAENEDHLFCEIWVPIEKK